VAFSRLVPASACSHDLAVADDHRAHVEGNGSRGSRQLRVPSLLCQWCQVRHRDGSDDAVSVGSTMSAPPGRIPDHCHRQRDVEDLPDSAGRRLPESLAIRELKQLNSLAEPTVGANRLVAFNLLASAATWMTPSASARNGTVSGAMLVG
jgi:hypothetical protein